MMGEVGADFVSCLANMAVLAAAERGRGRPGVVDIDDMNDRIG